MQQHRCTDTQGITVEERGWCGGGCEREKARTTRTPPGPTCSPLRRLVTRERVAGAATSSASCLELDPGRTYDLRSFVLYSPREALGTANQRRRQSVFRQKSLRFRRRVVKSAGERGRIAVKVFR